MHDLLEVGPWAKDKLARLEAYLRAYTAILKKQTWLDGYVYIDAFAGSGRIAVRNRRSDDPNQALASMGDELRRDPDARQILDGSPRVALDLQNPFTTYVFVECDAARDRLLESLVEEYKGRRTIRVRTGNCNDYLKETIAKVNWAKWRGVVFLDPFGMQVPWSTISGLAETKAIEVFLNFPVGMSIQRLLKRNGHFSTKEREKLDNYFGDPAWFEIVYPELKTLFGPMRSKAEDAERRLVEWYCGRLKGAFGSVSSAYLVTNSQGGHLYFLIFAGPKQVGTKIANYVLGTGSKLRAHR
jgi:three-Cys-motif partner protein